MIVVYDRSFIVLARVITIVNYDPKSFIVQATGNVNFVLYRDERIKSFKKYLSPSAFERILTLVLEIERQVLYRQFKKKFLPKTFLFFSFLLNVLSDLILSINCFICSPSITGDRNGSTTV
jgi:hypothetical protein